MLLYKLLIQLSLPRDITEIYKIEKVKTVNSHYMPPLSDEDEQSQSQRSKLLHVIFLGMTVLSAGVQVSKLSLDMSSSLLAIPLVNLCLVLLLLFLNCLLALIIFLALQNTLIS